MPLAHLRRSLLALLLVVLVGSPAGTPLAAPPVYGLAFSGWSRVLPPQAGPTLSRLGALLRDTPTARLEIEGYPARGALTRESRRIGFARAMAVRAALIRNGAGPDQVPVRMRDGAPGRGTADAVVFILSGAPWPEDLAPLPGDMIPGPRDAAPEASPEPRVAATPPPAERPALPTKTEEADTVPPSPSPGEETASTAVTRPQPVPLRQSAPSTPPPASPPRPDLAIPKVESTAAAALARPAPIPGTEAFLDPGAFMGRDAFTRPTPSEQSTETAPAETKPGPAPTPVAVGARQGRIPFGPGTATLGPEARRSLDHLAATLNQVAGRLRVDAYSTNATSAARRLSLQRGFAVRRYLLDKGVPLPRLEVVAHGPDEEETDSGQVVFRIVM